jgi:2-dehydro-3-deoxyphosphooctonate aldolase (KDO 8-P synthase)
MKHINVQDIKIGAGNPFVLIAGPCVIEDKDLTLSIASELRSMADGLDIPLIFKASYDKANRTSIDSFRGVGIEKGLEILREVKRELGLPILTDVHSIEEVGPVAEVVDVIQIPAFLCRQTDLVVKVAGTGKVVNVKKGQFLSPWETRQIARKITSTGNENIMLTERGTSFGYNNLVVDFRAIPIMRKFGTPVIFDATHSVQLPGGKETASGGDREMAAYLARAAVAVGVDGLFFEVYPDPDKAPCDGPNTLKLDTLPGLLRQLKEIDGIVKGRIQESGVRSQNEI